MLLSTHPWQENKMAAARLAFPNISFQHTYLKRHEEVCGLSTRLSLPRSKNKSFSCFYRQRRPAKFLHTHLI